MGNMSYYKKSIKLARETQYLPLLMQCTQKLGELTAKLQADISKRVVEETQHIAPPALNESDQKFLDEMAIFVKEHLADSDLSTISLAEEFCMSPRQFSRRVKQLTDIDTTHYVCAARILKGKKRLIYSILSFVCYLLSVECYSQNLNLCKFAKKNVRCICV